MNSKTKLTIALAAVGAIALAGLATAQSMQHRGPMQGCMQGGQCPMMQGYGMSERRQGGMQMPHGQMHTQMHGQGGMQYGGGQGHGQGSNRGAHGEVRGDQSTASLAFGAVNAKMHRDMDIAFTGDADVDFARGMVPHHQGAVDMAKIVLAFGKDPQIRKLAEDIVKSQEAEIAFIREWLKKRGE
jgi:uncharacterized protein (DUF305 family)